MQGPVSYSIEFGLSPKSCGQQGSVSAERMIQADRCFERWCWRQDWRSIRDGSEAETSVRREEGGLGQRAEQLWVCQQWFCQDVRREETKVQDGAGDCSCQEATADGGLEIRERVEETGAKQSQEECYPFLVVLGLHCGMQALCYSSRGFSSCGAWTLQLWHTGSRARGLSSCGTWAWLPHGMWDVSSPARDQTHVPCIGKQILNHWPTREVPRNVILMFIVV